MIWYDMICKKRKEKISQEPRVERWYTRDEAYKPGKKEYPEMRNEWMNEWRVRFDKNEKESENVEVIVIIAVAEAVDNWFGFCWFGL